ncbi:MAG: sulfide:quinone oxidoreductase [Thermoleophilaceae bacterium]|jgi:sulfide:quinone oxidoreductase|nr:sulfide:quinone oxidoreductase [Thermoleophilaceae bacterium]MEA2421739.1 sulfide:quinone oxidoreductase [Thermoleophilaceae bacterium]
MTENVRTNVIVAGGGVAAIEAMLALRDLAGDRVSMTFVAPQKDFHYRPVSVGEPFALGHALRLPLATVARDVGAELRPGALAEVDPDAHTVRLESGETLSYDALLVAVGALRVPALEHATTFRGQEDSESVHGLIQDIEGGYSGRIVFVVPAGVAWALPVYELALMAAQRAYEMSLTGIEMTIVTPEERPLAIFGQSASDDLERMLDEAGITVETSSRAEIPGSGTVILHPHGKVLEADRVVALPVAKPIVIEGLPRDRDGYIPVDSHGHVRGADDVYAAGDGTWFPVKQGGLACQQADAAADSIAAWAGADIEPSSFKPVLRGKLLTGSKPLFMRRDISGTAGDDSASSGHTLWWPPGKVAGVYLAPYLAAREQQGPEGTTPPIHRSHLPLESDRDGHGIELLGLDLAAPRA